MKIHLTVDDSQFVASNSNFGSQLTLSDCLAHKLLISPDSRSELRLSQSGKSLTDGINDFEIKFGCPILYPNRILENWNKSGELPIKIYDDPLTQYVLLSQIKQQGEINAPVNSSAALRHQYRFAKFCEILSGIILDIGCDDPSYSVKLFSSRCSYLGVDPYASEGVFRLISLGEFLPIQDSSVDAVVFNTSLDHILDYHSAIEEARRVLKPNGRIVIATYAWIKKASLLSDSVHFHHFREFEILGALEGFFNIEKICRYEDPKKESHRYGLYVLAKIR